MASINNTDVIFARFYYLGREMGNLRLTGMNDEGDVYQQIRQHLGNVRGMIDLVLRNATEGWSKRGAVLFR